MKRLLILGVALTLVAVLAASASATERKGTFGVDLGGVATLPMGDFGDAFKLGWKAGVGVGYCVTNEIMVGATGAYSQNKIDDTTGVGDAKFNILQFGAFGKYMFKMQNSRVAPYLKTGVGFYNSKVSVSGGSSASSTNMGLNGGLGVGFAVSPTASVFVEGAYHNIFTDVSSTNYMAVNAGLSFMFGGPTTTGGTE